MTSKKQGKKSKGKTFAERRTLNPPAGQGGAPAGQTGEAPQQQDPKRRLGNFQTAGEHARTGTRNK